MSPPFLIKMGYACISDRSKDKYPRVTAFNNIQQQGGVLYNTSTLNFDNTKPHFKYLFYKVRCINSNPAYFYINGAVASSLSTTINIDSRTTVTLTSYTNSAGTYVYFDIIDFHN